MPSEHWWNADFDLALQQGRDPSGDEGLQIQVRELALHALTAAEPEDSVLLYEPPPDDFLRYLGHRGVSLPLISIFPEVRGKFQFRPYGWSPQAIALKGRYDQPAASPGLETVRRVNGRSFGHGIETHRLGCDVPRGAFASLADLQALLNSEKDRPEGWVAKTEHGNAGLGNRRLRKRQLDEADIRWLSARMESGPMVLEWWLRRTKDLCSVFNVAADGRVEDFAIHETINTADGGFIGAMYDGEAVASAEWHEVLADTAETVTAALLQEGYFGPVCIDALVWNDAGTPRLRPLVDLNARRHASEGWRRLAEEWGGCLYGRFFSARKLRLPTTYEDFEGALGEDAWDPAARTGAIATSPLWLEGPGNRRRPRKLGVVFRGQSRQAVFAMETRFREVFEK
ncbi:MAG: hypothetical protein KAJ78_01180 [Acidobacteria bacterium]|nr:hypothetical protein [Acidobacteriota bacterium]